MPATVFFLLSTYYRSVQLYTCTLGIKCLHCNFRSHTYSKDLGVVDSLPLGNLLHRIYNLVSAVTWVNISSSITFFRYAHYKNVRVRERIINSKRLLSHFCLDISFSKAYSYHAYARRTKDTFFINRLSYCPSNLAGTYTSFRVAGQWLVLLNSCYCLKHWGEGGRGKQHKPEQCMDLQVENSFSKV